MSSMNNETHTMNSPNPETAPDSAALRRARRWLVVFGVSFVLLAAVTAVQVGGSIRQTKLVAASDGATILALAGVRDFAERADLAALMLTPVGADSMVMKARVFVGDESMGTYTVRMIHVESNAFRLRSTGRLKSGEQSMMCSLDVLVHIDETSETSPELGLQHHPMCNGSRHESAVTRVNIGS